MNTPTVPASPGTADGLLPADHGALPRWDVADLPAPPPFNARNLFKVIGPGAIMAATSIGGGEWLVGPAAAVKYSSSIFLIATVAIVLQVIFNLEAIRYTLYTGEPIYGGIMRLKPGPKFWAGFYTVLGFFQLGWPALAGSAAATLFGAWMGRMPGAPDQGTQAWIATGAHHRRRVHPVVRRHDRADARVLRLDDAGGGVPVPGVGEPGVRAAVALVADVHRVLQPGRTAASDRLGPDRRAGRHRRIRRHRQPDGDQLGPRQGLRHGLEGRRDPERGRRARDPAVARRHGLPGDRARTSRAGASGCATSTPIRSGCGACSASSGCS